MIIDQDLQEDKNLLEEDKEEIQKARNLNKEKDRRLANMSEYEKKRLDTQVNNALTTCQNKTAENQKKRTNEEYEEDKEKGMKIAIGRTQF